MTAPDCTSPSRRLPIVRVGIESDDRGHGSPEDQIEEIRNHGPANEGGRFCVGEFTESGQSGFKGERGRDFQRGIETAEAAASEWGEAELWLFHTSRGARGDGRKGRRSFLKLFSDLLYANVQVRSVSDDEFATRPMLVGIASEQAHKYSQDLSAHVSRGKRQQREEGARSGGPLMDGFVQIKHPHPTNPKRVVSEYGFDPERKPIFDLMLKLALEGVPYLRIAEKLNARGWRTKAGVTAKGKPKGGRPFSRKSITHTLEKPFFFGGTGWFVGKPNEAITWETHEGYGTQEDFEKLRAMRERRSTGPVPTDRPKGGHGRPNERFLLGSGFARCARCGDTMSAVQSTHIRKDGGRARSYVCKAVKQGAAGACDQPRIDAMLVDEEVLRHLGEVFIDWEGFAGRIASAQTTEASKLEIERDEAAERLADIQVAIAALNDRFTQKIAEGDDEGAEIAEDALKVQRPRAKDAERRVKALDNKLAEVVETPPVDEALDAWSALRDEVRGVLKRGTIREIREGLEPASRPSSSTPRTTTSRSSDHASADGAVVGAELPARRDEGFSGAPS